MCGKANLFQLALLGPDCCSANIPGAMGRAIADRRFGYAWLGFAVALGLHVLDEATHDFLSTYNPTAQAIRARLPFLPVPTFTFVPWLTGLLTAVALLLCLSPFAFRGARWIRIAAVPISLVIGVLNASLHLLSSAYYQRWMPGVYSSPLLITAGLFLLVNAGGRKTEVRADAPVAAR